MRKSHCEARRAAAIFCEIVRSPHCVIDWLCFSWVRRLQYTHNYLLNNTFHQFQPLKIGFVFPFTAKLAENAESITTMSVYLFIRIKNMPFSAIPAFSAVKHKLALFFPIELAIHVLLTRFLKVFINFWRILSIFEQFLALFTRFEWNHEWTPINTNFLLLDTDSRGLTRGIGFVLTNCICLEFSI